MVRCWSMRRLEQRWMRCHAARPNAKLTAGSSILIRAQTASARLLRSMKNRSAFLLRFLARFQPFHANSRSGTIWRNWSSNHAMPPAFAGLSQVCAQRLMQRSRSCSGARSFSTGPVLRGFKAGARKPSKPPPNRQVSPITPTRRPNSRALLSVWRA